jgi:hypothetical protein
MLNQILLNLVSQLIWPVKAVQSDWSVITDYLGTVIMDFDGYPDINTYDMPNNGIYQFTAEDQWSKTFSKWLTIKKSWNYTLKVVSSDNDSTVWSLVLVVWSGSATEQIRHESQLDRNHLSNR